MDMQTLLIEIRNCTVCAQHLELGPNPVLNASRKSKIILIGQAPGIKVHLSGVPWQDKSGDNLREWMGISSPEFYDVQNIAIVPMGFLLSWKRQIWRPTASTRMCTVVA